ncbi:MAG: UPF0182 protein [Acidimicrobiia bacterium]|nr:MAG: UPF0182 protein [Acidimicrobiia bacterium]
MRVSAADVPRRQFGPRGWLIGAAVVLVLLALSVRGIARFYTDYLWFQEVGFEDTWGRLLSAKAVPALIFSAAFFVVMLANLIVADRLAPRQRAGGGPEDEIIERYRTYVAPYAGRIRVVVALFFALVMGGGVAAEWRSWILFSNAVDFGVEDPQFGRDVGFYVFRLPFLQFAVGWTFAALLVVLIVTAVFHYLNGGIRLQSPWQRVTPQVKVHLSVILALMALTKTAQYYLARFELTFSRRGFVDGASYTDVNAQLPALNLLMVISIAAAALFIANIFRRGWVFPIIAVGLWGFISLVVGTIYPAVIQRFVVQPNELGREEPYIERNIEATRAAFGLDRVDEREFDYDTDLETADVAANEETLDNVRLWDPAKLEEVFSRTQPRASYYTFAEVDVDRYASGANERLPAFISPQVLDPEGLPDSTWTNRHLGYTHGCGAVVAAGNSQQRGEPSYLLRVNPPSGELASALERPDVYFSEGLDGYAIVNTKVADQQNCSGDGSGASDGAYAGDAGVATSGLLRRLALGVNFWDTNLIFSGQLTDESRILYRRDVKERVEAAAPFLRFDADPYPVVLGGRLLWVVDAYTTSTRYPYSQALRPDNLPQGSGLDTEFNYVRNSVKATVDAYDGTIRFYVLDGVDDPIVEAYRKAFPELFSDQDEMPEGLQEHWRYPEDLFRAQTEHFALYHMTDVETFFRKLRIWDIAPAPEAEATVQPAPTTTVRGNAGGRNTTLAATDRPIAPLYLTMQLPGERGQEFVLSRPFVPRGKANQLASFMVARSDPEHYGELVVYRIPDDRTAPSPARAASTINTDELIGEQFTLLERRDADVQPGSVQLLPLGDSIVYIRPIYVRTSTEGAYPRLRFAAVAYGDQAVLTNFNPERGDTSSLRTLEEAIEALITGDIPETPVEEEPAEPEEPSPAEPQEPLPATVEELLAEAADLLARAEEVQGEDLGEYQRLVEEARRRIDEAARLAAGGSSPAAGDGSGAPPASVEIVPARPEGG